MKPRRSPVPSNLAYPATVDQGRHHSNLQSRSKVVAPLGQLKAEAMIGIKLKLYR
jgi:hypothetical protein